MNKTAIKNFAIWARNKLIADISYRAGLMGITADGIQNALPQSTGTTEFYDIGTSEPYAIAGDAVKQRRHLVELIRAKEKDTNYRTAYKYVLEEVAYTWFNRLIAVRFMEVNDYLPSHIRVLSSDSGKMEPDLVTTPFDADLSFTRDEEQLVYQLKQENKIDELFRILFIKQCNALNEILPALFEKTSDYTELLLNLSVIDQDGVVYHLVHDIPEEDFDVERGGQVEIIGWLYQYYNTEPKADIDNKVKKGGKVNKEELAAKTQLFTPDWIVRYMVENSLGRLWEKNYPNDNVTACLKYYVQDEEPKNDEIKHLSHDSERDQNISLENIKIIDPCMGSGHILVYAFEVLMQIYESAGYGQRDAARSILVNNLYGVDIDDRAFQIAYFAVMMKARQYNRRILNDKLIPNLYSIQESNGINRKHLEYFGNGISDVNREHAIKQLNGLLDQFKDAKEFGSLIQVDNYDWELLYQFVSSESRTIGQVSFETVGVDETKEQLLTIVSLGKVLWQKYEIAITNPPYLGAGSTSDRFLKYIKKNYIAGRTDLFAVFMKRCFMFAKRNGFVSMITMQAWMFQSSFLEIREQLLENEMSSLIHLGSHAFEEISGEIVQTVAFVYSKKTKDKKKACFIDLSKVDTAQEKEKEFLKRSNRYYCDSEMFRSLPGMPFAYWISPAVEHAFLHSIPLSDLGKARRGLQTGNAQRFIRYWYEVSYNEITFPKDFCNKEDVVWVLENNGGSVRKWYNSIMNIVLWEKNGKAIKECPSSIIPSEDLYFKKCITWNKLTTKGLALKLQDAGIIPGDLSPFFMADDEKRFIYCFGFMNSCVAEYMMKVLNPTITTPTGDVAKIPVIINYDEFERIKDLVHQCVAISREDSSYNETSWEFKYNPLIKTGEESIEEAFLKWKSQCDEKISTLMKCEKELNEIFIRIFGLEEELDGNVSANNITLNKADVQTDVKSLLSYAVGCMFGRYSLDVPGIVYAGGRWESSAYESFSPDIDNIIPITDEEYLEDDIVTRFCTWLKKSFGASKLEENLSFIATALGNKGKTSRETIRDYFTNTFYSDHIKNYDKRPIYWMFDSGKNNGFKCLIYLHRYQQDTIGNLRIDYLHRLQRVYDSETSRMQDIIDHSTNQREVGIARKRQEKLIKQLQECRQFDEKLAHLALSRIQLDFADGIKENYKKIQTAADGKEYSVLVKM